MVHSDGQHFNFPVVLKNARKNKKKNSKLYLFMVYKLEYSIVHNSKRSTIRTAQLTPKSFLSTEPNDRRLRFTGFVITTTSVSSCRYIQPTGTGSCSVRIVDSVGTVVSDGTWMSISGVKTYCNGRFLSFGSQ